MTDLNVALRLSLINQMKSGAEAAKRELSQIRDAAEKAGKGQAASSARAAQAARRLERAEAGKTAAAARTSVAYRRQRSEMLATSLATEHVARRQEVRSAREAARVRREARSSQTAAAAAVAAGRRIEWASPEGRLFRSHEAVRRHHGDLLAASLMAERQSRAAEAKAMRQAARGVAGTAGAAAAGAAGAGAGAGAGGSILPTAAVAGAAAKGRVAGLGFARSFVGGLGIGLGAAAIGQAVVQSVIGAADDEFERDQLRVMANITEAQMQAHRKLLDRTARIRGVGSAGSYGVFGGLMAGGLSDKEAAAFTDNVVIFAKATKSSVDDATRSTVALRNNMKLVRPEDIMAAYDAIAVGGKVGEFEVQDMARHLPSLLAKMGNLGEIGVTGVRNTVALSQAVRKVVGSSDEAATIMENLLDTFTSGEFVAGAKKVGIDVERTMKDASKNGLSPVFAMLHAIEKKTGGDPFKIAKLIPNKRATAAAIAALREAGFMMETLDEMTKAAGSTMTDYEIATDNAKEAFARFFSSVGGGAKDLAQHSLPAITKAVNAVTDAMADARGDNGRFNLRAPDDTSPEVKAAVEAANERGARLNRFFENLFGWEPSESSRRLNFEDAHRNHPYIGQRRDDPMDKRREAMNALKKDLGLNVVDREDLEREREKRPAHRTPLVHPGGYADDGTPVPTILRRPDAADDGTPAPAPAPRFMRRPDASDDGTPVPSPAPRIFKNMLDGMENPARDSARAAMDAYKSAVGSGLDQTATVIASAVAEFKAMLNFTASPTITPRMASVAPVAPAGGQPGATGPVSVTQNISSPNSRVAARRAQREQNRTVRMAQWNALHDTGLA